MNIKQIKTALPVLMKHKIVPMLWGSQGEGKTEVVKQMGRELGFDSVIHLHLATQEVGDLTGLPIEQPDGTVKHARPNWFPAQGRHVIFLDEINRAPQDVLNAMFNFVLYGTIHTHTLPPECVIVAAGNYQSNSFQVTDTSDQAWMSRFCHLDFKPTVEDFIVFAEDQGAVDVANFIKIQPTMLRESNKDAKMDLNVIKPDPRAWLSFIHKLESESSIEDIRFEIYAGLIGSSAAAAFQTWKAKKEEALSGRGILLNYPRYKETVMKLSQSKEIRFDLLNATSEEIFLLLDDNKLDEVKVLPNFKQFLLDVPLELGLKLVNRLHTSTFRGKNEVLNNKEFVEIFRQKKENEETKVVAKKGKK